MLKTPLLCTARAVVSVIRRSQYYYSQPILTTHPSAHFCCHDYSHMTEANMKIDSPEFHRLFTPGLLQIAEVFEQYDYELRIAGGAVRDLLTRKQPQDVDFATTATPEQMKEMFTKEGIRMINATGEKHGTITARLCEENFEVTTLRIDLVTDGRHAEVEFTTDWQTDAERRDLTINSMFLGLDGTLYDFFNGKEDLEDCKILFVGDASRRIQEDFLRILRYFRFYGRIAKEPNLHCPLTLQAIRENAEGLSGISGERIWSELKKILVGNHADSLMECMHETELYPYMGLPSSPNLSEFHQVYQRSSNFERKPSTLLAALMKDTGDVMELNNRLKISAEERKLASFVVDHREDKMYDDVLKPYQDLIVSNHHKDKNIRQYVLEVLKYRGDTHSYEAIKSWQIPVFPVTGKDLIEAGVRKDKTFGNVLKSIKSLWMESNFELTKEELLSKLPDIMKAT